MISRHILLNQCGVLHTIKKNQLKGSSRDKNCLKQIYATSQGTTITLMHPEFMILPSIHCKSAPDNCSIVGSIPVPLLSKRNKLHLFASFQQYVFTRLTSLTSRISTDNGCCCHCYDMISNLAAMHEDARITFNRGLTIGEDRTDGLGVMSKGDSDILESTDNRKK